MKKGSIFICFLLLSLLIVVSPNTLFADTSSTVPFVAEFFIGGTLDGNWVSSDIIATSVPAGLEFRCYSFSKEMEVILRGTYYEGFWYEIFEFDGKSLKSVLSNGIGA